MIRSQGVPNEDLLAPGKSDANRDADMRKLLHQLNERHRTSRMDDELAARMRSYELAARMQREVPEVTNLALGDGTSSPSYGIGAVQRMILGRACLMSRRLLESGVRSFRFSRWCVWFAKDQLGWP